MGGASHMDEQVGSDNIAVDKEKIETVGENEFENSTEPETNSDVGKETEKKLDSVSKDEKVNQDIQE